MVDVLLVGARAGEGVTTKAHWKQKWQRIYDELTRDYPEQNPRWRFEMAHKYMRKAHGPEPPGLVGAAIAAVFKAKVKGESMEWKWSKAGKKGLRAALAGALTVGAMAAGEALLSATDTAAELQGLGAPALLVPVLLGVGAVIRNRLKKKKVNAALGYVTPPGPPPKQ